MFVCILIRTLMILCATSCKMYGNEGVYSRLERIHMSDETTDCIRKSWYVSSTHLRIGPRAYHAHCPRRTTNSVFTHIAQLLLLPKSVPKVFLQPSGQLAPPNFALESSRRRLNRIVQRPLVLLHDLVHVTGREVEDLRRADGLCVSLVLRDGRAFSRCHGVSCSPAVH